VTDWEEHINYCPETLVMMQGNGLVRFVLMSAVVCATLCSPVKHSGWYDGRTSIKSASVAQNGGTPSEENPQLFGRPIMSFDPRVISIIEDLVKGVEKAIQSRGEDTPPLRQKQNNDDIITGLLDQYCTIATIIIHIIQPYNTQYYYRPETS